MEDLQLCDTPAADMFPDPGHLRIVNNLARIEILRRHPAIAFPEQADEEDRRARTALIDLPEADPERRSLPALLLGNPPAQINLQQLHEPGPTSAAQLGKDLLHQFIPLPNEIPERTADEDPDETGGGGHRVLIKSQTVVRSSSCRACPRLFGSAAS